jgi:hypothetical protein
VRGVQKHDKKSQKINLTLVLFWPLTHPPTTGVTDFFLGRPLGPEATPSARVWQDCDLFFYAVPLSAPRSRAGCDNCTKGVLIALALRRLHRAASPLAPRMAMTRGAGKKEATYIFVPTCSGASC